MGQAALTTTARAHALRAVVLTWLALALVIGSTLAIPHAWFGFFVPIGGVTVIAVAAALSALVIAFLPLERVGDTIVAELHAEASGPGRLSNIADELSIAIGEPADHVVIHDAEIPNVGSFPTTDGVVVMATSQAVDQLRRDELEALVAAQFAGMRDRWCRVATRAELVWKGTMVAGFASIVLAAPIGLFVAVAMLIAPRFVEATRDLCADVAAVDATRHPAALAGAFRHLSPAASDNNQQRLVRRWYLPISPFLVLPKRVQSTRSVTVMGKPTRTFTDVDEVRIELELRADRAEALASGADPREYTGREYRRRWSRLGTDGSS